MESNLSVTLRNTIEALRSNVTENLKIIRGNEKIVRRIINQGLQIEESEQIEALYEKNRILLNQNKEAINIQLKMINFINSYRVLMPQIKNGSDSVDGDNFMNMPIDETLFISPDPKQIIKEDIGISEINADDYFTLTIENKIIFNKNHPYYEDDAFYGKLLLFYKKEEDYEMCARIVRK